MSQEIAAELLTVEQAFQQAIAQHQAGQLHKAEELYLAILQSEPNHPEANHNMGVLAIQRQQVAAALPYFSAALNAAPTCERYWLSAIDALFQADQIEAAREVLTIAQQQGFQGHELAELAARWSAGEQFQPASEASLSASSIASQGDADYPSPQETNTLRALFNEGRYPEATKLAQTMTEQFPLYGFGWKALGTLFAQMGRHADALIAMQKAAALSPSDAEAHYNLGNAFKSLDQLNEAETCYRQALTINPNDAEIYYNLGNTLKALGRLDEAGDCYQRALTIKPGDADACYNLGVTYQELGRLDEAAACYRQALAIKPNFAEAHSNLGNVLKNLGRFDEAETSYRQALAIKPDFVEAHYNLSGALQEQGRLDEAEASYRRVLAIKPDYAQAYCNLGNTLKALGRLNEAETSYRQALAIHPDFADAHYNLGGALQELGRLNEAEVSFRQALKIKPDFAEAHYNLGGNFQSLELLDEAEACFRQALQHKPDYASAYINLGVVLQKCGQLDDAEACFRRALAIKPDSVIAHSNLIFTQDLMDGKDSAVLLEERKRWDAAHAAHLNQQIAHANSADPERRIRIGYVSSDFREHSASKAFGGMLTCYDRAQFEVFAYSNFTGADDRVTELFKQNVTDWRNIGALSDDEVAKMIREDSIDILVDLSGHTAGHRLLVFARKPAPIQITAWGYAAGTGMRAMDVLFTDQVLVPPEDKHYFIEAVRYLPNVVGAFFIDPFPDVNELPALTDGVVTFGSLNRLAKVSGEAYRAWAQVLLAVPRSRLILKTAELDNAAIQARVLGYFTQVGVAAERIIMQGKSSWREHMQTYHRIDIGLDSFPQGGGVTALESLMMGVPIINLHGLTLAGRLSASIMTTLALPDWIAKNDEEYVGLAVRKATDLQSLAALRQQLRGIVATSALGDQTAYARAVEQEYRELWQQWRSSHT